VVTASFVQNIHIADFCDTSISLDASDSVGIPDMYGSAIVPLAFEWHVQADEIVNNTALSWSSTKATQFKLAVQSLEAALEVLAGAWASFSSGAIVAFPAQSRLVLHFASPDNAKASNEQAAANLDPSLLRMPWAGLAT